jgi:hypothetical protein
LALQEEGLIGWIWASGTVEFLTQRAQRAAEKKRRVSRENLDWINSGDVKIVKKGESKTERAAA